MTLPEIAQVLAAATALVAVVVGPMVTVYVARRQIQASVVSNNRQQWINNLRDTISDSVSKQLMARIQNAAGHTDDESIPRIEELSRLVYKINLLINPKESDHAELAKLVEEIFDTINQQKEKNKEFDIQKNTNRLVELSQLILKREWDRVKRGE